MQALCPVEPVGLSTDAPLTLLDDPIEQWLLWEEQANLHGFRTSTEPVPIEVAAVPRSAVQVRIATWPPAEILERFVRHDHVLFPRHPAEPRPVGEVLGPAGHRALDVPLHVVAHAGGGGAAREARCSR